MLSYMFYCTAINPGTYLVQGNILPWCRLVQGVQLCVLNRLSDVFNDLVLL